MFFDLIHLLYLPRQLQMLDVLVAGTCLMSIPLYYAPISVRVHCQSTLLVMVLLVVPVADDPINASTMFIGMGGSLAVSLLLWILQYKALQNDLQKYSYDINGTESLEDGDSAGNTSDKSAAVDIPVDATYSEMESNNGSKAAFSNSSNENKEQSILEDSKLSIENNVKASSSEDNVSSGFGRLSLFLSSSGYTIVGVIMAILALICFSMQEGDQYWYMHSLWHILIMGSVYPLLVGRKSFYDYMYNCISK